MSLIINQGKHEEHTEFKNVIENGAKMKIVKITVNKKRENHLDFMFEIIEGPNKGRKIFDTVPYLPSDPFAWKYTKLRSAAGVPYNKTESSNIDIEELLLDRLVIANLKEVQDKEDADKFWQRIDYITDSNKLNKALDNLVENKPKEDFVNEPAQTEETNEEDFNVDDDDDELPF